MEKVKKLIKGHQTYLLGKDDDGINHWLVAPSWDCGWYWGFGYVQAFTNNAHPEKSRDIRMHQHFDDLFLNQNISPLDAFKEFFKDTPLSDGEIWQLCDLMSSFYTLKKAAQIASNGYSHLTSVAKLPELLQDKTLPKRINEVMLPAIFKKIDALLS